MPAPRHLLDGLFEICDRFGLARLAKKLGPEHQTIDTRFVALRSTFERRGDTSDRVVAAPCCHECTSELVEQREIIGQRFERTIEKISSTARLATPRVPPGVFPSEAISRPNVASASKRSLFMNQ